MSGLSDGFAISLDHFRQRLTNEQRQLFASCNHAEARLAILGVQDRLGPEKRLQGFTRVKRFLDGLQYMEELVTMFTDTEDVAAFIWGPVQLAITGATSPEILELLLSTYQDVGDIFCGLRSFRQRFLECSEMQEILEIFFFNILELHHATLDTFGKQDWTRFFRSTASSAFRSKTGPIVKTLKRYRSILEDEKLLDASEDPPEEFGGKGSIKEFSADMKTYIRTQLDNLGTEVKEEMQKRDQSLQAQKNELLTKLNPPKYQIHQQVAFTQRHSESGDWVLTEPKFVAWLSGKNRNDNILYLSGIPGSGKTTLTSRIINQIQDQTQHHDGIVLYFYFKHESKDEGLRTKCGMLRALLSQIIDQDNQVFEELFKETSSMGVSEVQAEEFVERMVAQFLCDRKRVWIIIDGLDECNHMSTVEKSGYAGINGIWQKDKESQKIIQWALNLTSESLDSETQKDIRVLFSAQRDGYIEVELSRYPCIELGASLQHSQDIRHYVDHKSIEIGKRFRLDGSQLRQINNQISNHAGGMFLYAKVVLDNLYCQRSVARFEEELQVHFPKTLNAAYERIAIRVFGAKEYDHGESAQRIINTIITAGRPLRWREIQCLFCIRPGEETCNPKEQLIDSCKAICSSLVEVEPCELFPGHESEQIVRMVHESATQYLIQSQRVDCLAEHVRAVIFYSEYLCSAPISPDFSIETVQEYALGGYYGLHDYAIGFWEHHVEHVFGKEQILNSDQMSSIRAATQKLLNLFGLDVLKSTENEEEFDEQYTQQESKEGLDTGELHGLSRQTVLSAVNIQRKSPNQNSDALKQLISIRDFIENIDLDSLSEIDLANFEALHGRRRFKCPKARCSKFDMGYISKDERERHLNEHERSFKCPEVGCYGQVIGYCTSKELETHTRRRHTITEGQIPGLPKREKWGDSSPVEAAAMQGDLESIKAFHRIWKIGGEKEARLFWRDSLNNAIKHGHLIVAEFLIQSGCNPYHPPDNKYPIDIWIQLPIVTALLEKDVEFYRLITHMHSLDPNPRVVAAGVAACIISGSAYLLDEVLRDLDASQYPISSSLYCLIFELVCVYDIGKLERQNSDPDSIVFWQERSTLLHQTAKNLFPRIYKKGPVDVASLVIETSTAQFHPFSEFWIDPKFKDDHETMLYSAAEHGHMYMVDFIMSFLPLGIDPRPYPTHYNWNWSLKRFLRGASRPKTQSLRDLTFEIFERILETDQDDSINSRNFEYGAADDQLSLTPIHYYTGEDPRICRLLITKTRDLYSRGIAKRSVLQQAVYNGSIVMVKAILESGRIDLKGILDIPKGGTFDTRVDMMTMIRNKIAQATAKKKSTKTWEEIGVMLEEYVSKLKANETSSSEMTDSSRSPEAISTEPTAINSPSGLLGQS